LSSRHRRNWISFIQKIESGRNRKFEEGFVFLTLDAILINNIPNLPNFLKREKGIFFLLIFPRETIDWFFLVTDSNFSRLKDWLNLDIYAEWGWCFNFRSLFRVLICFNEWEDGPYLFKIDYDFKHNRAVLFLSFFLYSYHWFNQF